MSRARLSDLFDRVADGTPVDWARARKEAVDDADQAVIEALETVAKVTECHRGASWGPLEIIDRVGAGAYAEVFRAWDPNLGREIALKLYEGEDQPARLDRALEEARLLARLKHRNIVDVYGAERIGSKLGIWMELVVGHTLSQVLERLGPFDWRAAALCGMDLCSAVAAVHASGLVHADIKAENVMREEGGRIVLVDFGLGQRLRYGRTGPTGVGTPLYAAPEVFTGGSVSGSSDIYSLGVLLYHLVTCRFPVSGKTVADLRAAHEQHLFTALGDVRTELPPSFRAVVEQALRPDPSERYRTAGALEAALQSLLHPEAPPARDGGLERRGLAAGGGPLSIAVLPFVDMSSKHDQEYLCDGIAEEILNILSRDPRLRVVARTSSFQFRGEHTDIRRIGGLLNVDGVLEGSVRAASGRIRITVRLIDVRDGCQLWSEQYDRLLGAVFVLQDEIARNVVSSVSPRLGESAAAFPPGPQTDVEAYSCYLKARFQMNKRTTDGLRKAIAYCEDALRLDGRFARAQSCLADCYFLLGFEGSVPPHNCMPRAKSAAEQALRCDDTLAEGHASLGCALATYDWNWTGADEAFRRAIELNAGYATAHYWRAMWTLVPTGRFDLARDEIEQARRLDPLSPVLSAGMGWQLYFARDFGGSVREAERALEIEETFLMAHDVEAIAHARLGNADRALESARRAVSLSGERPLSLAILGHVSGLCGDEATARDALARLEKKSTEKYVSAYAVAIVLAGLGELERCLSWLERAREERNGWLVFVGVDPTFDALRPEPRFRRLVAGLGLGQ